MAHTDHSKVQFMEFWSYIATQLGSSRLKVNFAADSIHQILNQDSDHQPYLKGVITQSYKRSHCHHLNAPINVNYVLDILGEAAYELKGNQRDDLLDIELLEEIAWHIDERYSQHIDTIILGPADPGKKAEVLSLPRAKIKRANARP